MEGQIVNPPTEDFIFSLGVFNYNRSSNRQTYQKKKKKKICKRAQQNVYIFDFFGPIFSIVPDSFYKSSIIKTICSIAPTSMKEQVYFYESWKKNPFPQTKYTPLECFQNLPKEFWSEEWAEQIPKILLDIRKIRWIFRRFLHKWRTSKLKILNTEDIVTCEPPMYPVYIIDWVNKYKWVFEGSTILRDITNRLQHHDGFFEQPHHPRNPLTNLPLTHSQLISVWNQLQNIPIAKSQVFTAFRISRMNITSFRYDYRIPLQLYALRTTMSEFTHYDAIERVLDFIDMAFDRQGLFYEFYIWNYVIRTFPENPTVLRWRALCLRYYELELRYDNFPDHRDQQQNKIFSQTFPLLHKQDEMADLLPQTAHAEAGTDTDADADADDEAEEEALAVAEAEAVVATLLNTIHALQVLS